MLHLRMYNSYMQVNKIVQKYCAMQLRVKMSSRYALSELV